MPTAAPLVTGVVRREASTPRPITAEGEEPQAGAMSEGRDDQHSVHVSWSRSHGLLHVLFCLPFYETMFNKIHLSTSLQCRLLTDFIA